MVRKTTYTTKCSRSTGNEKEDLNELARKLLAPTDKNPYHRDGKPIANLNELMDNLPGFSEHEAVWVADWLNYLGDESTARMIRSKPKEFKKVIEKRHEELNSLSSKRSR